MPNFGIFIVDMYISATNPRQKPSRIIESFQREINCENLAKANFMH